MFQFISFQTLIVGIVVGISASILGVFVISRKMALISDALSHVALPGMAIALIIGINPFVGAAVSLVLSIIAISWLAEHSALATETLIGVFFTAALALGLLFVPREDLLEALFGDITRLSLENLIISIVGGVLVIFLTIIYFQKFAKITFSSDLALSEGISIKQVDLLFLFLLAATVAIGIKAIGTLLMGALIIVPAAAARNLSNGLRAMTIVSLIIGVASVVLGFIISGLFNLPSGPAVVLVGAGFFIISLIFKK